MILLRILRRILRRRRKRKDEHEEIEVITVHDEEEKAPPHAPVYTPFCLAKPHKKGKNMAFEPHLERNRHQRRARERGDGTTAGGLMAIPSKNEDQISDRDIHQLEMNLFEGRRLLGQLEQLRRSALDGNLCRFTDNQVLASKDKDVRHQLRLVLCDLPMTNFRHLTSHYELGPFS